MMAVTIHTADRVNHVELSHDVKYLSAGFSRWDTQDMSSQGMSGSRIGQQRYILSILFSTLCCVPTRPVVNDTRKPKHANETPLCADSGASCRSARVTPEE
jgi:hypothetical protein